MAKLKITVNKWTNLESEYASLLPALNECRSELIRQSSKLLGNENIALGVPVECRVKEWAKIPEKLERDGLNLKGIKELQDLVGLRFILLFRRDVSAVAKIIKNNFTIIRSYDTQDRLKEDQFGYVSVHYVVKLKEDWLRVPTFKDLGGIPIEIQVRSLAQHIWPAASHKLQYKTTDAVPLPVRRSLARASALLETVDLEFERVLDEREQYRQEADLREKSTPLNVDIMEKIFDSHLPQKNRLKEEDFAFVLGDLAYFGINTSGDLIGLIEDHLSAALETEKRYVEQMRNDPHHSVIGDPEKKRLHSGVFLSFTGLVQVMLKLKNANLYSSLTAKKWNEQHGLQSPLPTPEHFKPSFRTKNKRRR